MTEFYILFGFLIITNLLYYIIISLIIKIITDINRDILNRG